MKNKKTLYICGGGLSSVYTAGMLKQIEVSGKSGEFDCVVGVSSGSFSACFFVTKSASRGAEGYWKVLPEFYRKGGYTSLKNVFKDGGFLSLRSVINEMFGRLNPIDWNSVLESDLNTKGKLLIQAQDVETGEVIFFRNFKSVQALKEAVICSCSLPLVASFRGKVFPADLLKDVEILDREGKIMYKDKLKCFDGAVGDFFFRDARSFIGSSKVVLLTNCNRDFSNRTYAMGKHGKLFEYIFSWLLFTPYFMAILSYQKELILGGREREFNTLNKINDKSFTFITIPVLKKLSIGDVKSEKKMKDCLSVGREEIIKNINRI